MATTSLWRLQENKNSPYNCGSDRDRIPPSPHHGQWLVVGLVNGQMQLSFPTIMHPEVIFPLEHPEQREVSFPLAGRISMAVLMSTAPRLVHNNIFLFFIFNLFFLATNRTLIKKASKSPAWRLLLTSMLLLQASLRQSSSHPDKRAAALYKYHWSALPDLFCLP